MGRVKVKFFAHLRQAAGTNEADIEIREGETVEELIKTLTERFGAEFESRIKDPTTGAFAPFLIMVGREEISTVRGDLKHRLSDGDVVSLLEPVGGG
ncbi:MoaD family protein [Candidatus Bathyarchaeota archaeon]|nr:MoaD family protein [Candidatus Bathyarchaeota archaeon]